MSVIEDLMKEVTTVKDANEKLKSQLSEVRHVSSVVFQSFHFRRFFSKQKLDIPKGIDSYNDMYASVLLLITPHLLFFQFLGGLKRSLQ